MQNLSTPVRLSAQGYSIQNLGLEGLCREFGTPLYIYDIDEIAERYRGLKGFFPWEKTKLHYAMKANYNIDILKALLAQKAGIDAVSPSEVFLCLELGFTKEDIMYTANNMTDEEMMLMHEAGVLLNIDSLSCFERYSKKFPGSDICLRFNSEVVAGENEYVQTGGDKTKFGINLEDASKARDIAIKYNMKVIGLHEHTGSGIADSADFYQGMCNLLSIAVKENFPDLRFIDFGGGMKVPYHPEEKRIDYHKFGKTASDIFTDFCKEYGRELELYFEPGKYVVSEGGVLLMQVNTIKNNGTRLIAGTNSGFNHLIRPMLYNAYHHIINVSNPQGRKMTYDICGNVCETGDLFASDRVMEEIREGDFLAILNAGAYGFSMSSTYNLRPLPAEVVISKGTAKLSRPRRTYAEFARDIIEDFAA